MQILPRYYKESLLCRANFIVKRGESQFIQYFAMKKEGKYISRSAKSILLVYYLTQYSPKIAQNGLTSFWLRLYGHFYKNVQRLFMIIEIQFFLTININYKYQQYIYFYRKFMNFETQLFEFIKNNNMQVPNLRSRAINGNKQTLHSFYEVILKLLAQSHMHQPAYREINELLISGNPDIAHQIDSKIMQTVARNHCSQKLDQYIIFWKRIMSGCAYKTMYPNLKLKLGKINLHNENNSLSPAFLNFSKTFEKNYSEYYNKKVEFFDDSDDSLSNTSVQDVTSLEINLLEIKQIRNILENGQVKQNQKEEYLIKAVNFISCNPKPFKDEEYEQCRQWAKKFVESSGKVQNYNMKKNKQKKEEEKKQNQKKNTIILKQIPSIGDKSKKELNSKKSIVQEQKNKIKSTFNIVDQQQQIMIMKQSLPKRTISKRFYLDSSQKEEVQSTLKDNTNQNIKNQSQVKNFINKMPITKEESTHLAPSYYNVRMTSPQIDVKFIQDTDQWQNFMNQENPSNLQMNKSNVRRKIFPHTQQKNSQSPKEQDLIIKKYGDKKYPQQYPVNVPQNQHFYTPMTKNADRKQFKTQKNLLSHSPNTAFNYHGTTYKKLSEFNREKRQRRRQFENESLSKIQDYMIMPHLINFGTLTQFNQFRSKCLQNEFVLYSSPILAIVCSVQRISQTKAKIAIVYQSKCDANLSVQTLYSYSKAMRITKNSTIKKKWILTDTLVQHLFCLQIVSFPLDPFLIKLKYDYECNHEDLKQLQPTIISLPISMRNFLKSLVLNDDEWIFKWMKWTDDMNFRAVKNIVLQNEVVREDGLEQALKQFSKLNPIQGYSVNEFGVLYERLNISFLLRISQRLSNVLTLQVLSDKKNVNRDETDFIEYCLNTWAMLLAKIQYQS